MPDKVRLDLSRSRVLLSFRSALLRRRFWGLVLGALLVTTLFALYCHLRQAVEAPTGIPGDPAAVSENAEGTSRSPEVPVVSGRPPGRSGPTGPGAPALTGRSLEEMALTFIRACQNPSAP